MNSVVKKWSQSQNDSRIYSGLLIIMLLLLEADQRIYSIITTERLTVVLLTIVAVVLFSHRNRSVPFFCLKKSYVVLTFLLMALYIYTMIVVSLHQAAANTVSFPPRIILYNILRMLFIPILLTLFFDNVNDFCKLQTDVAFILSIFSLTTLFFDKLRMWGYQYLTTDDGRLFNAVKAGTRTYTFGSLGATASVILLLGSVFCIYCMIQKIGNFNLLVAKYFIIALATCFIGRTGLYIQIALMGLYFSYLLFKDRKKCLSIVTAAAITTGLFFLLIYTIEDPAHRNYYLKWVFEFLLKGFGEGSTFAILKDMPVPDLNSQSLIGHGIIAGETIGGEVIATDIGYLQNFAAIGLIGVIVYYGAIIGFYLWQANKIKDQGVKWLLFVMLFITLILEYKEPFLRKSPILLLISTVAFIQRDKESRECYPNVV